MAKAKTNSLLRSVSGKVAKKDNETNRCRFGQQEIYNYRQQDKRAPMTPSQKNSAHSFGGFSKLASLINKDPQASAEFRSDYLKLPADKRPQILYRYILSRLNSDNTLVAKYQHLL